MRRLLFAALLAAAPLASASAASLAAALLEDAATFRQALPAVAANASLSSDSAMLPVRLSRASGTTALTDAQGASLATPPDGDAAFARALLLAALGDQPPAPTLASLGCDLGRNDLGLFFFAHPDESLIVRRIGNATRCWVGVEPEIARPREWAVMRNGQLWVARIGRYDAHTNGWFPERLDIVRNGQRMLSLSVTSVAPSTQDLPPLLAPLSQPVAIPAVAVPAERPAPVSPRRLPL